MDDIHEMVCNGNEFTCPICGRWFIVLSWLPFKRIILNAGDEAFSHTGMKMETPAG